MQRLILLLILVNVAWSESELYPSELFTNEQITDGFFILYFIGIIFMLIAIEFVCEQMFVPVLETICIQWKIREDVAGATFMAIGSSAPELFTNIVGIFVVNSTEIGFGAIVGSAVFNILFAIGACSFFAKKAIQLSWWPLVRDSFWYAISIVLLAIFYFDN